MEVEGKQRQRSISDDNPFSGWDADLHDVDPLRAPASSVIDGFDSEEAEIVSFHSFGDMGLAEHQEALGSMSPLSSTFVRNLDKMDLQSVDHLEPLDASNRTDIKYKVKIEGDTEKNRGVPVGTRSFSTRRPLNEARTMQSDRPSEVILSTRSAPPIGDERTMALNDKPSFPGCHESEKNLSEMKMQSRRRSNLRIHFGQQSIQKFEDKKKEKPFKRTVRIHAKTSSAPRIESAPNSFRERASSPKRKYIGPLISPKRLRHDGLQDPCALDSIKSHPSVQSCRKHGREPEGASPTLSVRSISFFELNSSANNGASNRCLHTQIPALEPCPQAMNSNAGQKPKPIITRNDPSEHSSSTREFKSGNKVEQQSHFKKEDLSAVSAPSSSRKMTSILGLGDYSSECTEEEEDSCSEASMETNRRIVQHPGFKSKITKEIRKGKNDKNDKSKRKSKTHRTYTCDYCGKICTQRSNIVAHVRIHTGEKPFVCKCCKKSFTQKSNLKRHLKTHNVNYEDLYSK
mmetsp:Transcript_26356/g.63553  ORF Transcript_26356/g.63553 Transcript_26356/m.63553 type:complete len:516 (+) Transcript_26356:313-1860(+)|eukprot:CAMPEP_0114522628 /NCGR_PEP_ID=MMETSP0109-20121206/20841_1 /TAXON_ID=29199 /ORGANISM="Chlorarachnion reptans, Strain CCCM449" /LENGTH=515 /DNA_ID=CAMNT_0001703853 /DNA_START=256 /DNA_END=1803 /DNA_ORIENTATION=+